MEILKEIIKKADGFQKEAERILARHETSKTRIILLENTYDELKGLSIAQDDLFKQALRCVENSLYRAAHVMAWAAFIDFFENKLGSDGFKKFNNQVKNSVNNVEELRETYVEYRIITNAQKTGLCSKNETKALLGLLNKRNECAHPSGFYPGLNETLGYVSELLKRLESIKKKKY